MILNQRKEDSQISVQLFLQDKDKLSYATCSEYLKMLGYFESIISSAYQQCMLKCFKRIIFPEYTSKANFSNFKLLVTLPNSTERMKTSVKLTHPIGHDRSGQNARRKTYFWKSGTSINHKRSHGTILVMYFNQNDFLVRNTATLNVYWQTLYVYYARSIH